jgi:HPt (histidine-containing phosphotransfer) domain-containing protein
MDYSYLASQLGFDEDEFMELVELFVETSLSDLDRIRKGLADQDLSEVAAGSHSIKGAAGNLGFEALSALALEVEMAAKQGNMEGFDARVVQLETRIKELET